MTVKLGICLARYYLVLVKFYLFSHVLLNFASFPPSTHHFFAAITFISPLKSQNHLESIDCFDFNLEIFRFIVRSENVWVNYFGVMFTFTIKFQSEKEHKSYKLHVNNVSWSIPISISLD